MAVKQKETRARRRPRPNFMSSRYSFECHQFDRELLREKRTTSRIVKFEVVKISRSEEQFQEANAPASQ